MSPDMRQAAWNMNRQKRWPMRTRTVPDITATEGHDGGSSVLSEADDRRPLVSGLK
jgi:hypothetical protein